MPQVSLDGVLADADAGPPVIRVRGWRGVDASQALPIGRGLSNADCRRKTGNRAWTIGDLLHHLVWSLELLPSEVASARRARVCSVQLLALPARSAELVRQPTGGAEPASGLALRVTLLEERKDHRPDLRTLAMALNLIDRQWKRQDLLHLQAYPC